MFDDLCQIGEMTVNKITDKSNAYICKAVKNAMLKAIPKRRQEPLRDRDFPTLSDIELSPMFFIEQMIILEKERAVFVDHYVENISVKNVAKKYTMSMSSVYRILSRLKKDFANVI